MSTTRPTAACALASLFLLLAPAAPAVAGQAPPAATQPAGGERREAPKENLFVYNLRNANAVEAARVLTAVFRANEDGAAKPAAQAVANPRTNCVIVTGPDDRAKLARRILGELDADAAGDARNADAKLGDIEAQLRSLLKEVQALREQLHAAPKGQGRTEEK